MANFKYKTRGNSNPQGKPRVYFCCHPKDFDQYFVTVSDEIVAKQNCAIWYPEDRSAVRDEEFLSDLRQMQLFVMPVTTNLLCTENETLTVEFNFAIENHIPVLPLIQEGGLEKLFNRKCGDLQFLDKNNRDTTAISYDEKLERYLSSVLIGDELAERIRAAFDAYVFLSYRKKDRKYAQELMRLIHKNDFCQDIAIWYDEFLTPGKDFNHSIKDALKKSDLFVLAVTPNLVNETNYIMTIEYRMAQQEGKPVLPAEMVPTDKDLLAQNYRDIPECIHAYDDAELSGALLDLLKDIAIRENDTSPEHNFFIGLAYLNGVDVEVDHEKAVSLITGAAEAGIVEAVAKLVEMYRTGLGVERNYETAIEWQEKKITLLEKEYQENADAERLEALFWAITHCGDDYRDTGRHSKAKEKYTLGMHVAQKFTGKMTLAVRRSLSVSYYRLGGIANAEGNLTEAKKYYINALLLGIAIAKESYTIVARRDLSVGYNRLGDIEKAEGNLSEAKEYYLSALKLSAAIAEETDIIEARRGLAVSYNLLGDVAKAERNLPEAKTYYVKGFELFAVIAEEADTIEARRDLLVSYIKLGDIARAEGDRSEAKRYYLKSLELSAAIAKETDTIEARRDLWVSHIELGDIARAEENRSEAKRYCLKALELSAAIAKETDTIEARQDLWVSHIELGDIARAEGNRSEAKRHYLKALELSAANVEEVDTIAAKEVLAVSYNRLGDIAKTDRDLSEARVYYLKSLELSVVIAEKTGTIETRRDLWGGYIKLGDIAKTGGDRSEAQTYYLKALELAAAIAEETDTTEVQSVLAWTYYALSNVVTKNRAEYLQNAISIYEELYRQSPDNARYKQLLEYLKSQLP